MCDRSRRIEVRRQTGTGNRDAGPEIEPNG